LTDRLAVRIYVNNSGRTIKLHTEDNHLSQIITTFSTGLTALNGLTAQVQNLAVGTSGTDFAISSVGSTHTFNLPTASATNRGALSSADWSTFNGKVATTRNITINGTTQDLSADRTFSAVMLTGLPNVANIGLSGAVRYFAFSGVGVASSEVTRRIILTNNMTLKNFYIYTSTAQPATGSHVLTIFKNGVATAITITIPSGSAAGLFSDTTNSESFAQGDAISIQAVNNATTNSGTIVSLQIGSL
jgi:hypothetical protein